MKTYPIFSVVAGAIHLVKRRSLDDIGLSVLWYDWRDGTAINQLSFDWLGGGNISIFKGISEICFQCLVIILLCTWLTMGQNPKPVSCWEWYSNCSLVVLISLSLWWYWVVKIKLIQLCSLDPSGVVFPTHPFGSLCTHFKKLSSITARYPTYLAILKHKLFSNT